jgi:hypothetical protein
MFSGQIVWKGIVYSILMVIAKGAVSLVIYSDYLIRAWQARRRSRASSRGINIPLRSVPTLQIPNNARGNVSAAQEKINPPHTDAMLVGFAMIARGEIGFLIASLSQSSGTLTFKDSSGGGGEAIFLVIVWAVILCTIIGPVAVGIIVRMKHRRSIDG